MSFDRRHQSFAQEVGLKKICFGQQPCGLFPKRFLISKIETARRLKEEMNSAEIIFFYHDSDHDYRETITPVIDRETGLEDTLNFRWVNKIQKKYVPLYLKKVCPEWKEETLRRLPRFTSDEVVETFASVQAELVADFCLEFYQKMGWLDGLTIVRSSDLDFRKAAPEVSDYFVDVPYKNEIVRARKWEDGLRLHRGGQKFHHLGDLEYDGTQISPTRDSRLAWMQGVVRCTHYVAGASEVNYLDTSQTPEIEFIERDFIEEAHQSYVPI